MAKTPVSRMAGGLTQHRNALVCSTWSSLSAITKRKNTPSPSRPHQLKHIIAPDSFEGLSSVFWLATRAITAFESRN